MARSAAAAAAAEAVTGAASVLSLFAAGSETLGTGSAGMALTEVCVASKKYISSPTPMGATCLKARADCQYDRQQKSHQVQNSECKP